MAAGARRGGRRRGRRPGAPRSPWVGPGTGSRCSNATRCPADGDPEEAFVSERRGAPQVHQTHGFLARIVVELREHFPDVLDALARGRRPHHAGHRRPRRAPAGRRGPRRARRAAHHLRVGAAPGGRWPSRTSPSAPVSTVAGLVATPATGDGPPTVTGVRAGRRQHASTADVVVAAMGRRSPVPAWLAEHGVEVAETIHQSGLMYLSRWYRLAPGAFAELDPKLGGDLRLREVPRRARRRRHALDHARGPARRRATCGRRLSDPAGFEEACRLLPGPDQFFRDGPLEPVGGVRPMAGLLNRLRRFADDDGDPLVLGFHAIGDAHTCTNPLYGRGCSLALVQALRLAAAAGRASRRPGGAGAGLRGGVDPGGRRRPTTSRCRWTAWERTRAGRLGASRFERTRTGRWPRCSSPGPPTRSSVAASPGSGTCSRRAEDLMADPEFVTRVDGGHGRPGRVPPARPGGPHPRRAARRPRGLAPNRPAGQRTDRSTRMTVAITERTVVTPGAELHVVDAGEGPLVVLRPRVPRAVLLVAPPDPGAGRRRLPGARARPAGLRPVAAGPTAVDDYDILAPHRRPPRPARRPRRGAGRVRRPRLGLDGGVAARAAAPRAGGRRGRHERAVPAPRRRCRRSQLMRQVFGDSFFYILYFQEPGVADAELGADPAAHDAPHARRRHPSDRGGASSTRRVMAADGRGFVDRIPEPDAPARLADARPSSTTTSPSSPAPASPAASTGTATSTATGS